MTSSSKKYFLFYCLYHSIFSAFITIFAVNLRKIVDRILMFRYNKQERLWDALKMALNLGSYMETGRREINMAKTIVRDNESLDDALRRFKRSVSKSGTLQEYRKREFYEKPSVKRKLKSEAARKRKKFR